MGPKNPQVEERR